MIYFYIINVYQKLARHSVVSPQIILQLDWLIDSPAENLRFICTHKNSAYNFLEPMFRFTKLTQGLDRQVTTVADRQSRGWREALTQY